MIAQNSYQYDTCVKSKQKVKASKSNEKLSHKSLFWTLTRFIPWMHLVRNVFDPKVQRLPDKGRMQKLERKLIPPGEVILNKNRHLLLFLSLNCMKMQVANTNSVWTIQLLNGRLVDLIVLHLRNVSDLKYQPLNVMDKAGHP